MSCTTTRGSECPSTGPFSEYTLELSSPDFLEHIYIFIYMYLLLLHPIIFHFKTDDIIINTDHIYGLNYHKTILMSDSAHHVTSQKNLL